MADPIRDHEPLRLALGVQDAVAALDIPRSSYFELIKRGEIATFRVGKRRLVTVAELQRFLAAREAGKNSYTH